MKDSNRFKNWTKKIAFSGAMTIIAMILVPMVAAADKTVPNKEVTELKNRWGIEIVGIRSTAADYMLDFRYKVVDAEKAEALFRRKSRPQLIDQESGAKMNVYSSPKTGPMRSTNKPRAGKNYFILFANPGKYIQVGNKVTVVIDDFKIEDIVVQ